MNEISAGVTACERLPRRQGGADGAAARVVCAALALALLVLAVRIVAVW